VPPEDAGAAGDSCITFRAPAVVATGAAGLALGLGLLAAAGLLGAGDLASGVAVGAVGVVVVYAALGRVAARVEVRPDRMAWTWGFARHEVAYDDVVDVTLAKAGAAPGFRSLVLVRRQGPPVRVEAVATFALPAVPAPACPDHELVRWAVGAHHARAGAALSST
jgi:hypothetical protein